MLTSPLIMLVMLQGKRMWGAWHVERCPLKGVIPFLRVFYPSVLLLLVSQLYSLRVAILWN